MRKGLLLLALAGPGCLTPAPDLKEQARKAPAVPVAPEAPPPPVVTPDEITEANAAQKAEALARDIERDAADSAAPEKGAAAGP